MECKDLLAALNDYVDGEVDPTICDEFRHHLEGCNPCQVVVDNIRQTIALYCNGEPVALPPALAERIRGALRERWAAKFPQKTG